MTSNHPPILNNLSNGQRLAQAAETGRVRVAIPIGGAFQGVAQRPQVAGCHLTLYVDVATEVTNAGPATNVVRLTLAAGHTIGTLIKVKCPKPLKAFLDRHPGVNLNVGLAQLRAIGKLAVEQLLADPTFSRFVRSELLDPLMILTNGTLLEVELVTFASGAGGTGGPVATVLLAAIFQELKHRTQAIVHLRSVRAGSLSYVGLGERVHSNGAATLAEDVYMILDVPRHEREVRSLYLTELPMVKVDGEARAGYATQFAQALSCGPVQQQLDMMAPNLATQSEFGTITIFNLGYWTEISPRRVAEDANREYLPALMKLRDTPSHPARLQQVRPVATYAPSATAPSVEELMTEVRASQGVEPADFIQRCSEPTERFTGGTVTVTLAQSEGFELDGNMLTFLRQPARTLAEWADKFETIRTTQEGLRREIVARDPEVTSLARRLETATRQLQKAMELQYPKGMARSVASFLASPRSKLVGLQNAISKVRELSLQNLKLKSDIDLLSQASARLQDVLAGEERRVHNLLALLQPFQRPPGSQTPRLVETAPLDAMLPELVRLAEQGRPGTPVLRALAGSVLQVTLAGLAAIAGASEPDPGCIARRLLMDKPVVRAPRWGGRPPSRPGLRMLVLPPVDPGVLEAIRAQLPALDGNTIVVAGETAHGGANVVELEVHSPQEISEIFSQFLKASLDDARAASELHAGENDPALERINARLDGIRVAA